jgi:L-alanine-DL-glutamate epimerase-like enolase superfamily enzyme
VGCRSQPSRCNTVPHGSQDIHIHLVSAISNGLILEFYRDTVDPMWGLIYRETLKLNDDGTVSAPMAPGIGIEPNEDVLAPYRIA